jgi:hypothetical protein
VCAFHGRATVAVLMVLLFGFPLFVFVIVHSFLCSQSTLSVAASSLDFSDFVDGVSLASFTALAYGLVVAFGQRFQLLFSCNCSVAFALLYSPLGFLFCNEGCWSLFKKKEIKEQGGLPNIFSECRL